MAVVSPKDPAYLSENGAFVIQSICNPREKGQLWKWKNISRLCNGWYKCLTVDFKLKEGMSTRIMHYDINGGKRQQKWYIKENKPPNEMGFCLGVASNSDSPGARLVNKFVTRRNRANYGTFLLILMISFRYDQ